MPRRFFSTVYLAPGRPTPGIIAPIRSALSGRPIRQAPAKSRAFQATEGTMTLRGVILAGGKGTRLGELTKVTNKHLLPVGPMPMVYHPLKKFVGAGLRDVLLVSGTEHMGDFVELLGSGREHNCTLTYRVQDEAGGIAQALGLAALFCHGVRPVVILGDNIFHDPLGPMLEDAGKFPDHAWVALKRVPDPGRYGVAELRNERVVGIEEKPQNPKSDYAVAGIYIYPADVFEVI